MTYTSYRISGVANGWMDAYTSYFFSFLYGGQTYVRTISKKLRIHEDIDGEDASGTFL